MRRMAFGVIPIALLVAGCASSRILIESSPPGAAIYKSHTLEGPWQRVPDSYSVTPLMLNLFESDKAGFLKAKKYGFSDSEVVAASKVAATDRFAFSISPVLRDNVYDQFYEKSILQAHIPEQERKNVAVLGFSALPASEAADLPEILTELFQDILVKTKAFNIVERRRLETVLKEQKLQQSGLTDILNVAALGKVLNADEIVLGTIRNLNSGKLVSVSMIDVESAKIVYSDTLEYRTENEVKNMVLALANKLIAERFRTKSP